MEFFNLTLSILDCPDPLIVHRILADGVEVNADTINAWWETGWMGMGTAPNMYPIRIPRIKKPSYK